MTFRVASLTAPQFGKPISFGILLPRRRLPVVVGYPVCNNGVSVEGALGVSTSWYGFRSDGHFAE